MEWADKSQKERTVITPGTPLPNYIPGDGTTVTTGYGLTSSQSQPIYVPGKYSPSSCLSDKEEDEIYGLGYGIFAAQIAKQQQRLMGQIPSHQPLLLQQQHNYQTCLSPRSAYFYEFPPNDQNINKKRTTFSKFLRSLKTSHRKEKHGTSSPRHGRAATRDIPQRVDTPDSVLQSGLGLTDLGQHAVLRSIVDPRDYDRLRYLQMNGSTQNSFEETIYKLKLQEALRKREKFTKDHEEANELNDDQLGEIENKAWIDKQTTKRSGLCFTQIENLILRDIKQGLQQLGEEGIRGPLSGDDTYMYDEDARMLATVTHNNDRGHWYDEPPYESDPEDFLMGSSPGPTATIQNGRVCFTLNLRQGPRSEGVISLRSAGDISVPRDTLSSTTPRGTPRHGLILPQVDSPPTIKPLRSSRDGESEDYTGSDGQSDSSRLSVSYDTNRSERRELCRKVSPKYCTHLEGKLRYFRNTSEYSRNEDGFSASQSSDYEDQRDISNCAQQIATVHELSDGRSAGVSAIVDKVRGLRENVQRKISKLKSDTYEHRTVEQAFPCSASSVESLPSGSGSSTQALVRADSTPSSISTDEPDSSPTGEILGRARALVDYIPSPYDKDALTFKTGDIIDIISMSASGQWRGMCSGKKGTFKFINVELLSDRLKGGVNLHRNIKDNPISVKDLLQSINLQKYLSLFILNGYEDLELFKEIEPSDLDYLRIINADHRAKILIAVQLLHDLDSDRRDVASTGSEDEKNLRLSRELGEKRSPFRSQFSRNSGYYGVPVKITQRNQHISPHVKSDISSDAGCHNKNNLDSIVEQCCNDIIVRVRQVKRNSISLKTGLYYQKNVPNIKISNVSDLPKKIKESYHEQTTFVIQNVSYGNGRKNLEESEQKVTSRNYVDGRTFELGLNENESLNIIGRCCLSEISSDSGVSSSSLSSTNTKEYNPVLSQHLIDVPADDNVNLSYCANHTSTTAIKKLHFTNI